MIENYKDNEVILYLVVGVLTTIINILSFFLFESMFHMYYVYSNMIAWALAVLFSYFASKKYVFNQGSNENNDIKSFVLFTLMRLLTLVLEIAFLFVMIDVFSINTLLSKVGTNIIVLVLNYVFSKYLVFR